MDYESIAHFIKIGGTVFFFAFFFGIVLYVFWRKDAKTKLGAALPAIIIFFGITASIYIAAQIGGVTLLIVALLLLAGFVFSLRFFRSVDDERFSEIANLPLEDESLIPDNPKL